LDVGLAVFASSLGGLDVPKHYTVSDGELVLFLWPAEEGGYNVASPLDPALITQAETVEEAFIMARDAWELLQSTKTKAHQEPRLQEAE
jgi:antitoxin HicB